MDSNNPCKLDGFAFLEFSGPKSLELHEQFIKLGFKQTARYDDITKYAQGNIEFILNHSKASQAEKHAKLHGPGACAMGFNVADAQKAYDYVLSKGATAFFDSSNSHHGLLGIEAIGGSVIYFVDSNNKPFHNKWGKIEHTESKDSSNLNNCANLEFIDHLTHNVYRGNMDKWAKFYIDLFNFYDIRYFDIKGKQTGLISRALSSPCGKIKIPLNESKDDSSQIEEFLHDYHGEGIQHIALATKNIYKTIPILRNNGVIFLDVPESYYDMLNNRLPWTNEPLDQLRQHKILIDGEKDASHGILLQLFTENIFGPVFFEIIDRRGNEGFGEGNFQALFEAIERDQIRRGTLQPQA